MSAKILDRREVIAEKPQMQVKADNDCHPTVTLNTTNTAYTRFTLGDIEETYGARPIVTEYDKSEWPYASEDDYDEE